MSMSDCSHCWETPCVCGHDYTSRRGDWLDELIKTLEWVRDTRLKSEIGEQRNARDLTDGERKAFKVEYPHLRVPYCLNQLNPQQMTFIASLKENS